MKDDLTLARERLDGLNKRLVVVRDGLVVAEIDEPGIAATLACLEQVRRQGPGAAMADKIVGRAAAWAAIWAGVTACYGQVLSQPAQALLADHGLAVETSRRVANILNMARSGPCPLEEAVADARAAQEAVDLLRRLTPQLKD